jgi:hypothetical protein
MLKKLAIILFFTLFISSCFSSSKEEKRVIFSSWNVIKNSTWIINNGTWLINKEKSNNNVCLQVVTYAKNLKTWDCRAFSTTCEVPENYKKVDKCYLKEEKTNFLDDVENKTTTNTWIIQKKDNKTEKQIVDDFEKDLDSLFKLIDENGKK